MRSTIFLLLFFCGPRNAGRAHAAGLGLLAGRAPWLRIPPLYRAVHPTAGHAGRVARRPPPVAHAEQELGVRAGHASEHGRRGPAGREVPHVEVVADRVRVMAEASQALADPVHHLVTCGAETAHGN